MAMTKSTIVFGATREANIKTAYEWLDRAVRLEADGKSKSMIDMALNRAVTYEDHAFTLPANA